MNRTEKKEEEDLIVPSGAQCHLRTKKKEKKKKGGKEGGRELDNWF